MLKEVGNVLKDYSLVGVCICATSFAIRPFVSVRQSIRDAAITFAVSTITGLLLEYVDIPNAVKFGLSGVAGLFGVRIYMIVDAVLFQVQKHPEVIVDKITKDGNNV